ATTAGRRAPLAQRVRTDDSRRSAQVCAAGSALSHGRLPPVGAGRRGFRVLPANCSTSPIPGGRDARDRAYREVLAAVPQRAVCSRAACADRRESSLRERKAVVCITEAAAPVARSGGRRLCADARGRSARAAGGGVSL